MKLKVIQTTFFKQSTLDSSKLPLQDKVSVNAGRVFDIHSWKAIGKNHLKIALFNEFLGDPPRNTWYVYQPHVQLLNSQGQTTQPEIPKLTLPSIFSRLPKTKSINIPYKSQLDNVFNPRGACNVTSYAMVMDYFKIPQRTGITQFEDELYQFLEDKNLSRWDPYDLSQMGNTYGLNVNFTTRASLQDIRKAIAEGYACIIHGYFTSFGHIMVVRGYDQNGFFVNDPYGEWFESGYNNDASGENLHYSNDLIKSKCSPEGENYLWLHRITKK
jgi:hypothetical protein